MFPGPLGAPFAPIYRTLTSSRRLAYDRGWLRSAHGGPPTFSVGALEVGGTGKTPIARWLLRGLLARGHRPGLLTRGYGRRSRALEVHEPGSLPDPERIGDEPALIAESVPVPIVASADRLAGARALAHRVDSLVLDDGFSHRRLRRDLDIVVLRAEQPPSELHHLPWGPLRESSHGLRRAQVLWIHGVRGHERTFAWLEAHYPNALTVQSRPRMTGVETLRGQEVMLLTAIARPERVAQGLAEAGVAVFDTIVFPDHHRFSEAELLRVARAAGGRTVVCTAKDAVKIADFELRPVVVDVEVELWAGEADFWERKVEPLFTQHPHVDSDKHL